MNLFYFYKILTLSSLAAYSNSGNKISWLVLAIEVVIVRGPNGKSPAHPQMTQKYLTYITLDYVVMKQISNQPN